MGATVTVGVPANDWAKLGGKMAKLAVSESVEAEDRAPRSGALLVGRERELGELHAALHAALDGRGGLVLIAGEAGIGKTRLVEELAHYAAEHDAQALWAHCWAGDGAPAFWPWTQLIRAYAEGLEPSVLRAQLGGALQEVAPLVPELLDGTRDARAEERGPEQARFALLDGVGTLFHRAAATRPLLLIIEDLHWADLVSLELLRFLARQLSNSRELVVATFRDSDAVGEESLALALSELSTGSKRVSLTGLELDAVAQLVSAMRPLTSTPDALVADVHRRTAGNPFFVREVTRLLDASTHRQPRTQGVQEPSAAGVPAGVRELLLARCERLPEQTRSVLEAASVIGPQFAPEMLTALCADIDPSGAEPSGAVQHALEHAIGARILRPAERAAGRYEFVHALFAETIYDTLAATRRAELHRVCAQTIERLHAADLRPHLAELAEHYRRALSVGTIEQAIDYSLRSGEAARAVFAWEEVARQLQAALVLIEDRGGDPAERAELLGELGSLMYAAGLDRAAEISYLERALAIYEEIGDDARAGEMHLQLGLSLAIYTDAHQDVARGIAHLRAGAALIGEAQAPDLRVKLLTALASAARSGLRIEEAAAAGARAVALADRATKPATWSLAVGVQGACLVDSGRVAEGMALIGEAWEAGDRVNHESAAFFVAWMASIMNCHVFAPLPAQAWCERELAKPRTEQAPVQRDKLLTGLAQAHGLMGDLAKARELAEQIRGIALFEAVLMWGEDEQKALASLGDMLAVSQRAGHYETAWRTRYWLGRLHRIRGEHQAAEVHLRAGLALAPAGPPALFELSLRAELALLCLQTEDMKEAQTHSRRSLELLALHGDWHGLGGRAQLAVTAVAAEAAEGGEAPITFATAIATFRRCRLPWDEAEALHLWGRSLAATGEVAQAREKLQSALALYHRHGAAAGWTERVQRELKGLRAAGRPVAAGDREQPGAANAMTRQGEYWTIVFDGKEIRLRNSKGLEHLAVLLARPGEELHVLELAATGAAQTTSAVSGAPELHRESGDAGALLDPQAKAAYRERITELEAEAEQADAFNDPERAAKVRSELDSLTHELARAVGLGGRDRRGVSASERARVRITLALRKAAKRIETADPGLGQHLKDTLRTGNYCSYRPDRRTAIPWRIDAVGRRSGAGAGSGRA
jgi:tetratricopeptide (TPR) repeat protein